MCNCDDCLEAKRFLKNHDEATMDEEAIGQNKELKESGTELINILGDEARLRYFKSLGK